MSNRDMAEGTTSDSQAEEESEPSPAWGAHPAELEGLPPRGFHVGPDETPIPLSVDAQWELVGRWLDWIEAGHARRLPTADAFVRSWDAAQYADALFKPVPQASCTARPLPTERGVELRYRGETPLHALFNLIADGEYPPPELLLALSDAWRCYMVAEGKLDLEKAFNGPKVPGLGNLSGRFKSKQFESALSGRVRQGVRKGLTQGEAAEQAVRDGSMDSESLLRRLRRARAKASDK